ncbi:branched-chain amino acid ABC transporter permease [Ramlibacter solisilvae]|uniref:ABC transporter permease n=1 Tax=Ramlibacter tataouinensis TaxID=94132 RepID=A0A127JR94_9BURK|nr:branched-chain amino acid ABC transporter permease [Ramlibacter tataouinensis]AMO22500.1 ABC transporter permease [Ramlibacter tataouinensis]
MGSSWLQFVAGGLTSGAIYALVALGFAIVFNASGAINFAQGEFVMVGSMSAVTLLGLGLPLPVAVVLAIAAAAVVALIIERIAIAPARHAETVTLIIITIGVSLFLRGLAQLLWGTGVFRLPGFSGDEPIAVGNATILPQSLWVLGGAAVSVVLLATFYRRTLLGKAMLATSYNRLAAQLVGIDTRVVLFASFGLAAALGAIGGVLIAPIAFTSYDAGIMLGLKGFAAAMLGGLGSFAGAVAGGLLLGLLEGLGAGFVSSAYKDAIAFVVILAVLFFLPGGLLGTRHRDRV